MATELNLLVSFQHGRRDRAFLEGGFLDQILELSFVHVRPRPELENETAMWGWKWPFARVNLRMGTCFGFVQIKNRAPCERPVSLITAPD
jgi:hypothetical protein